MPTVASEAARIDREGELVQFARTLEGGQVRTASVKAFVRGYRPDEVGVGASANTGIVQGDRVAIVAPSALEAAGWPDKPRKPDRVTIDEGTAIVQSCELRKLRGQPCRYVVQLRGN